jgi:hypothetical protein
MTCNQCEEQCGGQSEEQCGEQSEEQCGEQSEEQCEEQCECEDTHRSNFALTLVLTLITLSLWSSH